MKRIIVLVLSYTPFVGIFIHIWLMTEHTFENHYPSNYVFKIFRNNLYVMLIWIYHLICIVVIPYLLENKNL